LRGETFQFRGEHSELGRHDLDKDKDLSKEVSNAALALANMVKLIRTGKYHAADEKLHDPREK